MTPLRTSEDLLNMKRNEVWPLLADGAPISGREHSRSTLMVACKGADQMSLVTAMITVGVV